MAVGHGLGNLEHVCKDWNEAESVYNDYKQMIGLPSSLDRSKSLPNDGKDVVQMMETLFQLFCRSLLCLRRIIRRSSADVSALRQP